MRNMFDLLSSYANWMIANYQAIAKINAEIPVLRLVSEERDKKTGEVRFKIQISGKNIFPIVSLQDLNNPETLANFSQHDQKIIHSYFYYQSKTQKIMRRIIARTYDRVRKRFTFTIESFDIQLRKSKCTTVDTLSPLMDDIHTFDKEDIRLIELESKN